MGERDCENSLAETKQWGQFPNGISVLSKNGTIPLIFGTSQAYGRYAHQTLIKLFPKKFV
jgi:hypothetical protein